LAVGIAVSLWAICNSPYPFINKFYLYI